jgi:hypothetical protein
MINKKNLLNKEECEKIKTFILNNEERIKSLGPDIYEGTSDNSLTGRYSVYNFMYDLPGDIIIPKLKEIFIKDKLNFPINIQSWANIFRKNEGIKKHAHSNDPKDNFICANLFIYGDETIGTTFIINEKHINYKNNIGEIMFFPCNLEHYVNKNEGNDIRITMAFDIHLDSITNNTKRFYTIL